MASPLLAPLQDDELVMRALGHASSAIRRQAARGVGTRLRAAAIACEESGRWEDAGTLWYAGCAERGNQAIEEMTRASEALRRVQPETAASRRLELAVLNVLWITKDFSAAGTAEEFRTLRRRMTELCEHEDARFDTAPAASFRATMLIQQGIDLEFCHWDKWPTTAEWREIIRTTSKLWRRIMLEYKRINQELEPDPLLRECKCQQLHSQILYARHHVLMSPADWEECCGEGGETARLAIELYNFERHSDRCKSSSTNVPPARLELPISCPPRPDQEIDSSHLPAGAHRPLPRGPRGSGAAPALGRPRHGPRRLEEAGGRVEGDRAARGARRLAVGPVRAGGHDRLLVRRALPPRRQRARHAPRAAAAHLRRPRAQRCGVQGAV